MLVHLRDKNVEGLRQVLVQEGDTLVDEAHAEVIIPSLIKLPEIVVDLMNISYSKDDPMFIVTKFWDGEEWLEQLMIGIPYDSVMNKGMGARAETGLATRFLTSAKADSWFANPTLRGMLGEQGYKGPVTLGVGRLGEPMAVWQGIPYEGIYNVYEGVKGKISEWWRKPTRLYESWVVNLVVSRFPWPLHNEADQVLVEGLGGVKKHFWVTDGVESRRGWSTTNTKIGVATGWSYSHLFEDASKFVLETVNSIKVPQKQIRTDLGYRKNYVYHDLLRVLELES